VRTSLLGGRGEKKRKEEKKKKEGTPVVDSASRIVEYATREQAQHAVNTLSNQNLMGRLVYVREVS
jgi:RNA recognition motif-containing protein